MHILSRPVVLAGCLLTTRLAEAEERVPLSENFSTPELVGIGAVLLADVAAHVWQAELAQVLGPPRLGDPPEIDRAASDVLYPGPGTGRFLSGAPDLAGAVWGPALALGFYGLDAAALRLRQRSITGDVHADHEFVAFVEALGLTLAVTQATKLLVGRERPLYALGRDGSAPRDDETNLSFFSGHTSASFCIAAFVSRDVGDALEPERGFLYGRVVPATILYAAASVVGLSRIVDQKHYLTDVAIGAVVGGVTGHLIYSLHFDASGRPRTRGMGREVRVVAGPQGLGLLGVF